MVVTFAHDGKRVSWKRFYEDFMYFYRNSAEAIKRGKLLESLPPKDRNFAMRCFDNFGMSFARVMDELNGRYEISGQN